MTPRVLALGDAAWTVEFGSTIDTALNARVMALAARLAELRKHDDAFAGITDVVPTFRSLAVHFAPEQVDADALASRLAALAQDAAGRTVQGRRWRLPACFAPEFAPDLPGLAQAKGLDEAQVITRLLELEFRVFMIGFQPGFPYMGGVPPELAMPRLPSPRKRVPAQSIATAGEMCAVYPWESPGGWNLLGRTPLALFDLRHADQPAMLAAGDTVRWYPIEPEQYQDLLARSQAGQLAREAFLLPEQAP